MLLHEVTEALMTALSYPQSITPSYVSGTLR